MSKYIYSNKIAEQNSVHTLQINSYMGVDYSASMNNIKDYHAVEIKNLLKNNGNLTIRNGYEQVIDGSTYGELYGLWKCTFNSQCYTILHIGTKLYYVIGDTITYDTKLTEIPLGNKSLAQSKSLGLFMNDRLYILSNGYYVLKYILGSFIFKAVYNDIDTYVPTVYTGIYSSAQNMGTIKKLDDFNMLSNKAIIKLNTRINDFSLEDNISDYMSSIVAQPPANNFIHCKLPFEIENPISIKINCNINGVIYTLEGSNVIPKTINPLVYEISDISDNILGYVDMTHDEILIPAYKPVSYEDNVEFVVELPFNENAKIEKCTFGILYGAGGYRNRLFLSGNPDYPNVDYHSSRRNVYASDSDTDLQDSQDLTYFSVNDYCVYGTSNSAVMGYQIMGEGSLMVIKEDGSNENTVYFRTGSYKTIQTTEGDNTITSYVDTYPLSNGNIGVGCYIKESLKNLNNDLVYISTNGIYGISSTMTSSSLQGNYKYSFSRSRLINSRFIEDIKSSVNVASIIYDNKYIITTKSSEGTYKTYVADGRYKNKLDDDVDNEYQYEYFILEGIEANNYFILNNNLYYANNKGTYRLNLDYVSKKKLLYDVEYVTTSGASLVVSNNGNTITASENTLNSIKECTFANLTNDNYKLVVTLESKGNGIYYVPNKDDYLRILREVSIEVYSPSSDNTYYTNFLTLYAKEVEDEEQQIQLCTSSDLTRAYKGDLSSKIFGIAFATYEHITFKIDENSTITDFVRTNGQSAKFIKYNTSTMYYYMNYNAELKLTIKRPIKCKYVTKAYNFGQSTIGKVLRNITVPNDSQSYSKVNFGVITKDTKLLNNKIYGSNTFDFENLDIFKVEFSNSRYPSSFSKDYMLKFNFIQFDFYNTIGNDFTLNGMTIQYTFGLKKKGVN